MWIANPQNLDEYAYVNNNPMNHTDPTGMNACGTDDDKTCKVTVTITAREKNSKGKYDDGFAYPKKYTNEEKYNAIATVTVDDGKTTTTTPFLAKSTPDNSNTGATVADGTYASSGDEHRPGTPGAYPDIHVNNGGPVTTTLPDMGNHNNDFAVDIEIHRAGVDDATTGSTAHPVSTGCQTIQTDQYPAFQRATGLVPTAGTPQKSFSVVLAANGGDE